MPRALPLPDDILALTDDLTSPALQDAEIMALAKLADASPEDFQKGIAAMFRRLALLGFQTIQAPRNLREMQIVIDLWRKMEGLDKATGGGMPQGLVGVLRNIQRRSVLDVVGVVDEGFE